MKCENMPSRYNNQRPSRFLMHGTQLTPFLVGNVCVRGHQPGADFFSWQQMTSQIYVTTAYPFSLHSCFQSRQESQAKLTNAFISSNSNIGWTPPFPPFHAQN